MAGLKEVTFTVLSASEAAENICALRLAGDTSAITSPGQFVSLAVPGKFLRRPFSVCDVEEDVLTVIFKINGAGTEALAGLTPGSEISALTGLGNGYDLSASGRAPLLAAGGTGASPMLLLAKRLLAQGSKPGVILGFASSREAYLYRELESLGIDVKIATIDGSLGTKGLVTDIMPTPGTYSYLYSCGPEPMERALFDLCDTDSQFSLEERMGCGYGACMGCSRQFVSGSKRICRDGPVFEGSDIIWRT